MNGAAYYNEIEPYAAQWLRNLIAGGHIAPGDVDERSIVDVRADDLRGYTQCHFFAGIGVWSYALRLAGWGDDEPVWTGSCPCQPFSEAGGAGGFDDARHLWPDWKRLIEQQRPDAVFGEQVASADGLAWLDFVCADMEAAGYAIGPLDTCAAGFGAPHIRQRIYFVAHPEGVQLQRLEEPGLHLAEVRRAGPDGSSPLGRGSSVGGMAYADNERRGEARRAGSGRGARRRGASGIVADADRGRCEVADLSIRSARQDQAEAVEPRSGFWSAADWIPCADGKARPVEPGTFPLAPGTPDRVGRLRAYGNAINAEQAAGFIRAYRELTWRTVP